MWHWLGVIDSALGRFKVLAWLLLVVGGIALFVGFVRLLAIMAIVAGGYGLARDHIRKNWPRGSSGDPVSDGFDFFLEVEETAVASPPTSARSSRTSPSG